MIIVIALLIVIIALLAVILLRGNGGGRKAPENSSGVYIDQNAGKFTNRDEAPADAVKGVVIPGWSYINLPAGQKTADTVDFYNPEGNADSFYLTFQLLIPDDKGGYESVYQSSLVEPGLHIQQIELTRALEAGSYDAILHIQPYTMDENRTATNNADLKTTLRVG